jgi:protein-S-isoprenylcysteine O-methyltransferase Ste14
MNNLTFHIVFAVAFLTMMGIRLAAPRSEIRPEGKVEFKEGWLNMAARGLIGIGYIAAMLVYTVYPRYLAWAAFPLPTWARWVGTVLALASLPLLWWVQWALGKNFSTTLHVREGHRLVQHGPYRWVRHPMYSVLTTFGVGMTLLSANWVVGLPVSLGLVIVVVTRVGKEEMTMIEQFGDEYRAYMQRTGRFLPRLSR